ncbi:unnamed protein product [Acanthoscelides obtectus]|uniref:Uncharacterized protein n=1 Tax=Acanthoscelides obtectus TaxID=200917 RepID=A0A9P0QCB8_ACAOB|nr:unnamed protein product [Acanthoscelides obtectus]CAH2016788.1 unnamed protein product [Acanthoscelides obtectus]CAH2016976.1 unnamed protein product [Acanthoscelides obtectus]CAH2018956.1 unnamed protein product [Acanthoscelides obtectus]CAH2020570.1 unnamed protein product [Acanthoscelides obtectus]
MRNNNKHWQSFFAKIDGKYNFPLPIFFSILEIIEQGNKKINEINNKQESEAFNIFTLMLDPKRIILRR